MAFSLAIIIILGLTADYLFRKIKLPGLVGMLLVGVVVGPYVMGLLAPEMLKVSGDFRKIALVVILLRAGFELRRDVLHRVGRAAVIMSALPAIFEIAGIMWIAPLLLNISLLEAAILGAILAAVSPAVVVPLMIGFMDRGRGANKGIPTLILGASSLDDVFVIVVFTVLLGMYGGQSSHLALKLANIPISAGLGILLGIIPGYLLYRLFTAYDFRPPKRTLIVLGVSIMLTWIEKILEPTIPVAGLLGVMAIGFIILEKSESIAHIISQRLKKIWVFAEILLFVLVGAQVDIHVAWNAGVAGILVILCGLVCRSIGTYLSLFGTPFTPAEKLFCVVAYVPKATVQAAIGAVPLAAGVVSGDIILAVAVLSILVTAPIGAVGIAVLGEKILDHGEDSVYRFKELREKLDLPHVGERVREKRTSDIWKVIEEKELWLEPSDGITDRNGQRRRTPAISLRIWNPQSATTTASGITRFIRFTADSPQFQQEWEILYDW
ncbi:MAG: sodium:proton antiporter [Desulfobacteraceae bacterium]|nr:sodium:proton antiporter [Desulfobacteraceae bacterium]